MAATEGDRGDGGEGKKGKQLIPDLRNSKKTILRSQNHDLRNRHARKESAKLGVDISSVIKGVAPSGIEASLTLDISLRLECGLDGK